MQSDCFHPYGPVQRCANGLPCIPSEESSLKGVLFPLGWVHVSSVGSELVVCKMEMKEESIAGCTTAEFTR